MIVAAIIGAVAIVVFVVTVNHTPDLTQASRIGGFFAAGQYKECAKYCKECNRKHLKKELVHILKRAKVGKKQYKYVFTLFLYRTIFGQKPSCYDDKFFSEAYTAVGSENSFPDIQQFAAAYNDTPDAE